MIPSILNKKNIINSLFFLISLTSASDSDSASASSTTTGNYPILTLTPRSALVYDYHVQIGSPPQTLGLRLDICNGELWVPDSYGYTACAVTYGASTTSTTKSSSSSKSTLLASITSSSNSNSSSTTSVGYCASDGIYTASDSSSHEFINIDTNEQVPNRDDSSIVDQTFLDYVYIEGVYASDNFSIKLTSANDIAKIDDFTFRAVNQSDVTLGALAIGNSVDNVPTLLEKLVDEGYINSNGYSLSLGNNYGEILLGGVSKNRFKDELIEFDFIPIYDNSGSIIYSSTGESINHPVIPISGFGVTSNSTGKSFQFDDYYFDDITTGKYPRPTLLDSRNYYNYIPYSTLIDIAVELNAYYAESLNRWLVACDIGSSGTLDISMGNLTINIPISDLLFQAYDQTTKSKLYFSSGEYACFVGLLPDYYYGYSILGTSFLKNIYLAVDNEGQKLAMGPAVNLTETSLPDDEIIEPISSGYIPFAVTNNITSYDQITLTISTGTFTLSSDISPQTAVISNGEVFVGDSLTNTVSISQSSTSTSKLSASASGSYTSTKKGDAASSYGKNWNSFKFLITSCLFLFTLLNLL